MTQDIKQKATSGWFSLPCGISDPANRATKTKKEKKEKK
jgi:hypothetical protein